MKRLKKAKTSSHAEQVVTGEGSAPHSSLRRWTGNKRLLLVAAVALVALAVGGYFAYQALHEEPPAVIPAADLQKAINRNNNIPESPNASPQEKADRANSLGVLYMSGGQAQEAIPYLLKAESGYTTPAEKYGVWLDLASAYDKLDDKQKAADYYKKALDFAEHPPEGEVDQKLVNQLKQKVKELED